MPETPTPNMALIKPTEGSDVGEWDALLNDCIDEIDAHNHTAGNGALIPTAAININANLELNGFALTEAGAFYLNDVTALAAGLRGLFSTSGNLYWRDGSGTNIQLTNAGTLNASLLGGFAGDYSSVGAEAGYTDSTDTYAFKQQVGASVRQYARGAFGSVDLYEYKAHPTGTVPSNRVRLSSPVALAASYELTMPAALPGSTLAMQVSSAGAITASNTFSGSVTASRFVYTTSTPEVINIGDAVLTGTAARSAATSGVRLNLGSGGVAYIEVPFADGEEIVSVTIIADAQSVGSIDASLYDHATDLAVTTLRASGSNTSATAGATWTITPGTTLEPSYLYRLTLVLISTSGATNDIYSVVVNKRSA